jgi:endogenous inhibitor of DNA gyrase (YacG/DUF329 family)
VPLKVKCPRCRKEVPWEGNSHRPFCSDRCRLVDLGAWTQERYRIAGEEVEQRDDDDDDEEKKLN